MRNDLRSAHALARQSLGKVESAKRGYDDLCDRLATDQAKHARTTPLGLAGVGGLVVDSSNMSAQVLQSHPFVRLI